MVNLVNLVNTWKGSSFQVRFWSSLGSLVVGLWQSFQAKSEAFWVKLGRSPSNLSPSDQRRLQNHPNLKFSGRTMFLSLGFCFLWWPVTCHSLIYRNYQKWLWCFTGWPTLAFCFCLPYRPDNRKDPPTKAGFPALRHCCFLLLMHVAAVSHTSVSWR